MGLFLKPKTDPTNVSGTETRNHSESNATRVENGMAAELSFAHNIRFNTKKIVNTTPGQSIEVSKTFDFHFSPPKLLYILADVYPAIAPKQTKTTIAQVIKAPLLAGDKNPRHANANVTSVMKNI